MKRLTLTVTAILLAVPAVACAKTGISFQTPPEAVQTGHKQEFTVALFHEPRDPGGRAGPYADGLRPLVTFRSVSGRIVRVRAHALSAGVSYGYVRFPDAGPWHSTITVSGHALPSDDGPGFGVGTALIPNTTHVGVVRPHVSAPPGAGAGGLGWLPFLAVIPMLAAAAWLVRRRWPRGIGGMGAGGSP